MTLYRGVGELRPIPFSITIAATDTPTVGLFSDPGCTLPVPGDGPVVTGAGLSWAYQLPITLTVGTYYAKITAQTVAGQSTKVDQVVVTTAAIVVPTDDPPYFTPAELRDEYSTLGDPAKYSDAKLQRAHDAVVAIIESTCDVAFVVRIHSESNIGAGERLVRLEKDYARQLLALSLDGIPVESSDLNRYRLLRSGHVQPPSSWTHGVEWAITYTHGATEAPPADLRSAAMDAAKLRLTEQNTPGVPARALTITNELGNVNLASASKDRPFGVPDIDAVVLRYREQYRVPVIA